MYNDQYNQDHYVTEETIDEMSKEQPNIELVIKWAMKPREVIKASKAKSRIESVETTTNDYVREVFIRK